MNEVTFTLIFDIWFILASSRSSLKVMSLIKVDGYRMKNVAEVDGIGVTMSGGFLVVIVPCNAISCDFQQNVTP